jgi:hypothetical protein
MVEFWRVAHWLTGRHFVHLENSASEIIRLVRYTANGRPYVIYFESRRVWLDDPSGWKVTPLTNVTKATI